MALKQLGGGEEDFPPQQLLRRLEGCKSQLQEQGPPNKKPHVFESWFTTMNSCDTMQFHLSSIQVHQVLYFEVLCHIHIFHIFLCGHSNIEATIMKSRWKPHGWDRNHLNDVTKIKGLICLTSEVSFCRDMFWIHILDSDYLGIYHKSYYYSDNFGGIWSFYVLLMRFLFGYSPNFNLHTFHCWGVKPRRCGTKPVAYQTVHGLRCGYTYSGAKITICDNSFFIENVLKDRFPYNNPQPPFSWLSNIKISSFQNSKWRL